VRRIRLDRFASFHQVDQLPFFLRRRWSWQFLQGLTRLVLVAMHRKFAICKGFFNYYDALIIKYLNILLHWRQPASLH
jgi:hypothetical protein